MTNCKTATLGGVISSYRRLYPGNETSDLTIRRIIWMVDRAFAIETGQDVPKEYTSTTPGITALLVPKIHKELYYWAILRDANKKNQSDGATEHYSERYAYEKHAAVSAWKMCKKGGIDIDSFI